MLKTDPQQIVDTLVLREANSQRLAGAVPSAEAIRQNVSRNLQMAARRNAIRARALSNPTKGVKKETGDVAKKMAEDTGARFFRRAPRKIETAKVAVKCGFCGKCEWCWRRKRIASIMEMAIPGSPNFRQDMLALGKKLWGITAQHKMKRGRFAKTDKPRWKLLRDAYDTICDESVPFLGSWRCS